MDVYLVGVLYMSINVLCSTSVVYTSGVMLEDVHLHLKRLSLKSIMTAT